MPMLDSQRLQHKQPMGNAAYPGPIPRSCILGQSVLHLVPRVMCDYCLRIPSTFPSLIVNIHSSRPPNAGLDAHSIASEAGRAES